MSKYGIALATAGLSLIMVGQASAAITTYSFDGVVTGYQDGSDSKGGSSAANGTTVKGSITFDTDSLSYPDVGMVGMTQEYLSSAALAYSINFSSETLISYSNSGANGDLTYRIENDRQFAGGSIDKFQIGVGRFDVSFSQYVVGTSASMYSGNSLSILQPVTVDLASLGHDSRAYSTTGQTWVNFQVTNQSFAVAAVPEPETYAMLLAGLGLIGAAVKRRKAKQA